MQGGVQGAAGRGTDRCSSEITELTGRMQVNIEPVAGWGHEAAHQSTGALPAWCAPTAGCTPLPHTTVAPTSLASK